MWIAIVAGLLPLLTMLIKWLSGQSSLSTAQQDRLNRVIFKMNEVKTRACGMGCDANGSPDAMESGDVDIEKLASEIVDQAIKDQGLRVVREFDASLTKGKLADLISTLRGLGLTWDKILSFVSVILPMIVSGSFDWEKLLAWIQTLLPEPNPAIRTS